MTYEQMLWVILIGGGIAALAVGYVLGLVL
jgi:hypothetical protein